MLLSADPGFLQMGETATREFGFLSPPVDSSKCVTGCDYEPITMTRYEIRLFA